MTNGRSGSGSARPSLVARAIASLVGHWRLCAAFVGAVVLGVAIMGAWVTTIEHTNHTSFCITCHVMRDTVYVEYQQSKHFKNAYGVAVGCPDCHVPQYSWIDEALIKVQTVNELYAYFIRGITTAEAFTPERARLAQNTWAHFKATNARECRHCHDYGNMVLAEQTEAARLVHPVAMKTDQNCVDCHKGVVHQIPPGAE